MIGLELITNTSLVGLSWCLTISQSWSVCGWLLGWELDMNPFTITLTKSLWIIHNRSWSKFGDIRLFKMNSVWYLDGRFQVWDVFGLKVQLITPRDQSVIILRCLNEINILKVGHFFTWMRIKPKSIILGYVRLCMDHVMLKHPWSLDKNYPWSLSTLKFDYIMNCTRYR